jgi:hypothetical protein
MTSEGLVAVFKGDSAEMCGGKFPLVLMGGRADRQACAGARTPISASEKFSLIFKHKFSEYIHLSIKNHKFGL